MPANPREFCRTCGLAIFTATVLILALASSSWAQKSKKSDAGDGLTLPQALAMPAADVIERDIGEMLGAFQVGDVEAMHKYYSDNVIFVSAGSGPPVVGWKNYVPQYQAEKAAFQGMQLIRRNTLIFVHQDVSWATYQWEFNSMLNGKPFTAHGQTTLVLSKVGDNWLIVHNQTAEVCPDEEPTRANAQ